MVDQMLELPLEVIRASPGVAFDIGSSIAKIVYRSKEDFENGEPKGTEKATTGVGIIRQKLIKHENIDELIEFIKENVDMTCDEKGDCCIYSTGAGSNLFKTKIEEDLNVKLVNLSEFDCFTGALVSLLRTQSREELFKPLCQKGVEESKERENMMKKVKMMIESSGKGTFPGVEDPEGGPVDGNGHFPVLLAMCGSGFGFIKVNEDGTYEFCGGSGLGGRFFLGLVSYLADITDFNEISKQIEESTGATADIFYEDLFDPNNTDMYSGFQQKLRLFALGKGMTDDKDKTTKGDLIHSALESICENTARLVCLTAAAMDIPRIYFAGNFMNTPKAQQFITRVIHTFQKFPVGGKKVHVEFLKNGGILGALGAFKEPYNRVTGNLLQRTSSLIKKH